MKRAIAIDDSVHTCDCCGKSGLKSTVVMMDDDGEIAHYGSVCATRNSGRDAKTLKKEIREHEALQLFRARAEWASHPANLALESKLRRREREMPGVIGSAAIDFVRAEWEAAQDARAEIAMKYGVSP